MCVLPSRMPSGTCAHPCSGFISVVAASKDGRLSASLVVRIEDHWVRSDYRACADRFDEIAAGDIRTAVGRFHCSFSPIELLDLLFASVKRRR